jgi:hypothetical protein
LSRRVGITGFYKISNFDQNALLYQVAKQPVTAAVHVFEEFKELKEVNDYCLHNL